jgi:hypothetical protein
LLTVATIAVLSFLVIDRLTSRFVRVPKLTEVYDSIGALEKGNPDTLVLSSSHGRVFQALAKEVERRTDGRSRIVALPVEAGGLEAYQWVIDNRIKPLVDERRKDGRLVRDRLRRFVLATDYWDTCPTQLERTPPGEAMVPQVLPRSAWMLRDYLSDVAGRGVSSFNRGYVRRNWIEVLSFSNLARNRFNARSEIQRWIDSARRGTTDQYTGWFFPLDMLEWQQMLEDLADCAKREDRAALYKGIITFAQERNLELTLILFPKLPETITPKAMSTTVNDYREQLRKVTSGSNVRIVDLFFAVPLQPSHFEADLDHLNGAGTQLFIDWTLTHDLAFLLRPTP